MQQFELGIDDNSRLMQVMIAFTIIKNCSNPMDCIKGPVTMPL